MVSIGGEIVDKIGTPAKYIEQYSQVIQHQHSDIAVHDVRNGKKAIWINRLKENSAVLAVWLAFPSVILE